MAGGVSRPAMSDDREGQGVIGGNDTDATCASASPGTAMQGVAHADCGAFFSDVGEPLSSHPAIDDAIGAACALASQIGPNRTSSTIASTARRAVRSMLAKGRDGDFTPLPAAFSTRSQRLSAMVSTAGAATMHTGMATTSTPATPSA